MSFVTPHKDKFTHSLTHSCITQMTVSSLLISLSLIHLLIHLLPLPSTVRYLIPSRSPSFTLIHTVPLPPMKQVGATIIEKKLPCAITGWGRKPDPTERPFRRHRLNEKKNNNERKKENEKEKEGKRVRKKKEKIKK